MESQGRCLDTKGGGTSKALELEGDPSVIKCGGAVALLSPCSSHLSPGHLVGWAKFPVLETSIIVFCATLDHRINPSQTGKA